MVRRLIHAAFGIATALVTVHRIAYSAAQRAGRG